VSELGTDVAPC